MDLPFDKLPPMEQRRVAVELALTQGATVQSAPTVQLAQQILDFILSVPAPAEGEGLTD